MTNTIEQITARWTGGDWPLVSSTAARDINYLLSLLTVERLATAMRDYGLGHWSWRCEYPDKGENPCDMTDEATAILKELPGEAESRC